MASLESVKQKTYRARHHYEELVAELIAYYGIFTTPDSELTEEQARIKAAEVPPQRLGLILGDCLQCLRSSLDYLIWELVLANETVDPGPTHQFPICNTEKSFAQQIKRDRLKGIDHDAQVLITAMQLTCPVFR